MRIDGMWVGSFETEPELGLHRVKEALRLVKIYDTRRYERLIRDLERVWVCPIPGGLAHFDYSIWACVLDPRYVLDETNSPETIAGAIVMRQPMRGYGVAASVIRKNSGLSSRRYASAASELLQQSFPMGRKFASRPSENWRPMQLKTTGSTKPSVRVT
jgi:hypothetical protein